MMSTPATVSNVGFSFSGSGGSERASGFSLDELVKAKTYTKRLSELGLGVRMFLYVVQDVLLERVVWGLAVEGVFIGTWRSG
jgi:hypothetical protein